MRINNSVPVLVLNASTHGSLGIVRSLGRLGIPAYVMHRIANHPTAASKFCRGRFEWSFPCRERALEQLICAGKQIGAPTVLVPTCDETTLFVADHLADLSQYFIYPRQSAAIIHSLCSKKQMAFLAKQCDIPVAESAYPQSLDDVTRFLESGKLPVVVKAIDGPGVKRRAGRTLGIARTADQLFELYKMMEDPANPSVMLQEYIPGDDDTIWMFNGYFDEDSECRFGLSGRKLRQTPVYRGSTSLGICSTNVVVETYTKRFMKTVGYCGILDIGFRYDARDDRYKVLDVNPRIGSTFRLFVSANGMDAARAMYLHLTRQAIPAARAREGRKWIVEFADLKSCLDYRRDAKLTFSQWLKSLRGIEEAAYFAIDDIWPFWKKLFAVLRNRFSKKTVRSQEAYGAAFSTHAS
jgi:D-aspartate ligase